MDAGDPFFIFFEIYVFESKDDRRRTKSGSKVLSCGPRGSRALASVLRPVIRETGVRIHPSDNEVIAGTERLSTLRAALDAAIRDVEHRPPEWPVEIGFSKESP